MIKKSPAKIETIHYTAAIRQAYRQLQKKGVKVKYIPPAYELAEIMLKAGFPMDTKTTCKRAIIHWWKTLPKDKRIKQNHRKRSSFQRC